MLGGGGDPHGADHLGPLPRAEGDVRGEPADRRHQSDGGEGEAHGHHDLGHDRGAGPHGRDPQLAQPPIPSFLAQGWARGEPRHDRGEAGQGHHPPGLPGHTALGPPGPVLHRDEDQVDRRRDPHAEDKDIPVAPLALGLEPDVPKHQEPSSLVSVRKASSIVGRPSPELPSRPRPIARALTWSGVPSATRRPREITATRSATASASSSRWVANRRTRPWETQAGALSQNPRRPSPPKEAVGSPRTGTGGLPATAMASRRRWRW